MISCFRDLETFSSPISFAVSSSSAIGFCFSSVKFIVIDVE